MKPKHSKQGIAMRTVYVNGAYVPETEAKVSVFDRAFLFGDGIYEVASVLGGKLIDFPAHIARLHRSANELGMRIDVSDEEILAIHRELVSRNEVEEGVVYMQLTRGAVDRDFMFDTEKLKPTLVLFTQTRPLVDTAVARNGMKIVSIPDLRWGRCDIKTVQLLYPSLGKMEAKSRGADDAWMVRDGVVTEGTSNNAFIVTKTGAIVTRPLSNAILPGITRAALMSYSTASGTPVEEREFTIDEAREAAEAFITSASVFVGPVISIDGVELSGGKPGPVTLGLRKTYLEESLKRAI
ncbi:Branched-chain amino acid aminotransferase/4-amino-4-deoxychorismate lyase [Hoeflea phototrophica DFL-43]|jgi:D-alanine transaminase|uniref:Probable branched-chain-amino-acid aminotransferase n=1 Tax=Hoeflea phototrophica (strain DSM 17068 / NCIMB 14078 / DFL-43) TaxID=411684 RepID=A9DGY0_HOEPD|nr:D-amino-acid transaminase [Hoeflea phototrophica]EDQ31567.1 Branched-chain amino acid aminotransferase/4-amino-4-deoxychorismate lyase [Hoeflea phototrophica DFL-43]